MIYYIFITFFESLRFVSRFSWIAYLYIILINAYSPRLHTGGGLGGAKPHAVTYRGGPGGRSPPGLSIFPCIFAHIFTQNLL